jgi:hypothetical protein
MAVTISGSGPITGLTTIASPTTINGLTIPTTGFGKILQIVRATDVSSRSTSSTSFSDVTGMSVTITPQMDTSAILVISTFYGLASRSSGTGCRAIYAITDSSNNTVSGGGSATLGTYRYSYGTSALSDGPITLIGYATPATTSAVTYKLRFKAGEAGNSAELEGTVNTSQMYAIEVSA